MKKSTQQNILNTMKRIYFYLWKKVCVCSELLIFNIFKSIEMLLGHRMFEFLANDIEKLSFKYFTHIYFLIIHHCLRKWSITWMIKIQIPFPQFWNSEYLKLLKKSYTYQQINLDFSERESIKLDFFYLTIFN